MVDILLAVFSLWCFWHTEYFDAWSKIILGGGDQLSISLTALIVVIHIVIVVVKVIKWNNRPRNQE